MFGLFSRKKQEELEKKFNTVSDILRYGNTGTNPRKALSPQEMYSIIGIAFTAVEKITTQAMSFKYKVLDQNGNERPNHPFLGYLFDSNLIYGGQKLFAQIIRNLLIHGEAYALRMPYGQSNVKSGMTGFCSIFPQDVSKVQRNNNVITSYDVSYANMSIPIPIDQITGYSDLMRISLFSSKHYHEGISPMEAVGIEGRLIERVLNWNLSTLDKGLKPSGVLESEKGSNFTPQQQMEIMEVMRTLYTGAENANNVAILPPGVKLSTSQLTGNDMDFNTTFDKAMKSVSIAFKIPLPLLFSDASTLDNYKMAIEEFCSDTVIPLVEDTLSVFNKWFTFVSNDKARVVIDMDSIQALEYRRERKGERAINFVKNGILSPNEAREMMGYEPYRDETANSLFLPSSLSPIEFLDGEPVLPNVKE